MNLDLDQLPGTFAICRLDAEAAIPDWARGELVSITRTADELSIVCPQDRVRGDVQCESGWQCLRVTGPLDFSLVGVIASLTGPLAEAGISVFVLSTFDTDLLLVKQQEMEKAAGVLGQAGHRCRTTSRIDEVQ